MLLALLKVFKSIWTCLKKKRNFAPSVLLFSTVRASKLALPYHASIRTGPKSGVEGFSKIPGAELAPTIRHNYAHCPKQLQYPIGLKASAQ